MGGIRRRRGESVEPLFRLWVPKRFVGDCPRPTRSRRSRGRCGVATVGSAGLAQSTGRSGGRRGLGIQRHRCESGKLHRRSARAFYGWLNATQYESRSAGSFLSLDQLRRYAARGREKAASTGLHGDQRGNPRAAISICEVVVHVPLLRQKTVKEREEGPAG